MATITRMVLIVEYDGTNYYGFQWQAKLPTIQKELETAIEKLTGEKSRVIAASRTDTGVHAKGQVVGFRTASSLPPGTFMRGLNHYLPEDIAVKAAYKAGELFQVRRHAVSREYNYYILNSVTRSPLKKNFAYQVSGQLNIEAMNRACEALVGEHDLASFATCLPPKIKSTVRRIYAAKVEKKRDLAIFNIVGKSFLPHQVRNTVGALIKIGQGRMSQAEFLDIMAARKPGLARPTVPPHGLCLMKVNYARPLEGELS